MPCADEKCGWESTKEDSTELSKGTYDCAPCLTVFLPYTNGK